LEKEKPVKPKVHSSKKPSAFESKRSLPIEKSPDAALESSQLVPPEVRKVVPPDLPKATITIIRPTILQKEDSITARATDLMVSVKDKTGEAIDTLASTTGLNVKRTTVELNSDSEPLIIPIIEQRVSTETKNYTETITVEKREVERKKSIDVNVNYDEIFVNGKRVGTTMADTFKDIKDKILDIVSFDKNNEDKEPGDEAGEKIPLLGEGTEMETVIPLYAEEVVISKRVVKVAELIIHKRKVTQTRKIDVGSIVEELTIQNPTGRTPARIESEE
jgi:stress response protein YsnF